MDQNFYIDKLAYVIKSTPQSRQITDPFESLYSLGRVVEPPIPPGALLQLLEENPIHAACVAAKVDDAVGRGWTVEDGDQDEWKRKLEDITPEATWSEVLYACVRDLIAIGWGAIEVVRSGLDVAAIYYLPAHTLRVTTDGRFVQQRGLQTVEFAPWGEKKVDNESEVIFFRPLSPRTPYYGIPNWISAVPALAEYTAIREYNIRWFTSGGTTDRIIAARAETPDRASELARTIRDQLIEARGVGHTQLVLGLTGPEASIEVLPLSSQEGSREGQFLQRREDLIKEILVSHGVPPYRVGWAELGSLGGSAAEQMLEAYRVGVIEPIQTVVEDRLNHTLFSGRDTGGLGLAGRFRLVDLTHEQFEMRAKIISELVEHAVITPNEARDLLGLGRAEDPNLDIYYRRENLVPAEESTDLAKAISDLKEALEGEEFGADTTG